MIVPKIAIVTPVYNGEKTIENSIVSIKNQIFTDWVNIIINDGSTDRTKEILSKYSDDPQFHIINLDQNVGRGAARKIALEVVKKFEIKYMCMLDADDLYYPDKLMWQYTYMEEHADVALLSCSIGYINNENMLLGVMETFKEDTTMQYNNYIDYIPVPHACSIIRVTEIEGVTFDEELKLGQDQDFMIRMLLNKKYVYVPKIGYLYNRVDSFSFKKYKTSLELAYRAKRKLNLPWTYMLKKRISDYIKIVIVGVLTIFRKEDIYFSKISREPTKEELNQHAGLIISSLKTEFI